MSCRRCCRGAPVLVVLQEPAEDVDAIAAMADRSLAARRPGRQLLPSLSPSHHNFGFGTGSCALVCFTRTWPDEQVL
jgi:hypothetical protein